MSHTFDRGEAGRHSHRTHDGQRAKSQKKRLAQRARVEAEKVRARAAGISVFELRRRDSRKRDVYIAEGQASLEAQAKQSGANGGYRWRY